jgi:hypothetical protein
MRSKPFSRLFLIVIAILTVTLACSIDLGQNQGGNDNNNGSGVPEYSTFPPDENGEPAVPTNTITVPPPPPPTSTNTVPPPAACTPDSEFVADINIPDGTLIAPGTTFTKTWTIENDGTCTWTSEYTWEQIDRAGNKLLASMAVMPIPSDVAPGGTLDITVTLTLSATATIGERYDAFFQMRSPDGDLFGTHPYARIYAVVGNGVCPIGPTGQSLFVNTTDHYCFLYPSSYDAYIGATGGSHVNEPPVGSGEQVLGSVSISNYGSTGGAGTNTWAASMISSWEAPGDPPTVTNTTVGGEHAKSAEGLPGITGNVIVFQVNDGDGYVFTIQPVDGGYPAHTTAALDLWEMIRLSFTFYSP